MPPLNLRSAVEALLFSSDQPLTLVQLADALDASGDDVTSALHSLADDYRAREAGVEVREMAGGWIVTTTPEQHEWVGRMLRGKRRMRLSRAALETLAIIAYKQPVTKSEIEAIRGVDSSGTLATLLERALVTIKGRSTVVGRPLLYGSTPDFLNYFGLKDLAELPRPEELRALVAAREPEQMEMIELDGDGMPLALVGEGAPGSARAEAAASSQAAAGAEADAATAGGRRPTTGSAPPDSSGPTDADEADASAFLVSGDMPAASDTDEIGDADEDEEDEYDDEDDDEDEEDEEAEEDEEDGRPSATLSERDRR